MWVLTAAVLAGLVAGFLGTWLILQIQLERVNKKLNDITDFISPRSRIYVADENDTGETVETPSRLEQTFLKAACVNNRGPLAKSRILVDVKIGDHALRRQLMSLRERGDGQWLTVALEKMLKDRGMNRELLQLKRHVVPRGWNLVGIEPAYDSGEGLFVWFEIERPIADFKNDEQESRAA